MERWIVDLPDPYNPGGAWVNVGEFTTVFDAQDYLLKNWGINSALANYFITYICQNEECSFAP